MQSRVVTFGEVMMRLSTPSYGRFKQAKSFNVIYAGAEANVAAALALWGVPSSHVSCFPNNDIGEAAALHLNHYGVNTDAIAFTEGRLGLYFLEHGASLRAPKIIYDRFDSAFAKLDPNDFDWETILQGAGWFHWTGITPAISSSAAEACRQALSVARKLGITISGDINYRRNLWQYGKSAQEVMPDLISLTDIVVAGVTDFENCIGISGDTFKATCELVAKRYPNIQRVITTNRETVDASHNRLKGILWNGKTEITTPTFDLAPIVDRVGAGDAFMAGFIYASMQKKSEEHIINFATASGALKHTIEGDVLLASIEEIETLMSGHNLGKLLR